MADGDRVGDCKGKVEEDVRERWWATASSLPVGNSLAVRQQLHHCHPHHWQLSHCQALSLDEGEGEGDGKDKLEGNCKGKGKLEDNCEGDGNGELLPDGKRLAAGMGADATFQVSGGVL